MCTHFFFLLIFFFVCVYSLLTPFVYSMLLASTDSSTHLCTYTQTLKTKKPTKPVFQKKLPSYKINFSAGAGPNSQLSSCLSSVVAILDMEPGASNMPGTCSYHWTPECLCFHCSSSALDNSLATGNFVF